MKKIKSNITSSKKGTLSAYPPANLYSLKTKITKSKKGVLSAFPPANVYSLV